jgi:uncharacterized repeat protein (TIGR01451 family)
MAGVDPSLLTLRAVFDIHGESTMAFFDDMTKALETYPETNVVIEIHDFKPVNGNALDVGEDATFQVKVTNKGPLNLTNVKLLPTGVNDALLHIDVGALVPTRHSNPLEIHGNGGSRITEPFTLRAPDKPTKNGKTEELLKVTLDAWDANLDRILIDHSNALDVPFDIQEYAVSDA